jgi:hypothetical protein
MATAGLITRTIRQYYNALKNMSVGSTVIGHSPQTFLKWLDNDWCRCVLLPLLPAYLFNPVPTVIKLFIFTEIKKCRQFLVTIEHNNIYFNLMW